MLDEQDLQNSSETEGIAQCGAPACIEGETEKTERAWTVWAAGGDAAAAGGSAAAGDDAPASAAADEDASGSGPREPKSRVKGSTRKTVAICTIVAILFFFVGVFAANNGLQLFNDSPRQYAEGEDAPATEVAMRLYKVAQALDANGIYKIDLDSATQGAIEALLESTGDAHAEYYTEDAYKSYLQYTNGSYSGIGVVIAQCGKYTVVTNVYDDTPAAKAGVQIGDVAVSVDGTTQDWTPTTFTAALKREDGQSVQVEWLRPTEDSLTRLGEAMEADRESGDDASTADQVVLEGEQLSTTMEYGPITIPNIEYELKDSVGYIYLSSFNLESGDAVREAVSQLESQGAKSLVLDLRDNGGGYVSQATKIVSAFVDEGTLMNVKYLHGTDTEQVSGAKITDLPLVVLVNENSASASEIVASSLKDNGRATIVGTVTYGKGTVQDLVPLSFGGAIKYTVAEYLGANGETINEVGVQPDEVVEAATTGDTDTQLERALEIAAGLE